MTTYQGLLFLGLMFLIMIGILPDKPKVMHMTVTSDKVIDSLIQECNKKDAIILKLRDNE